MGKSIRFDEDGLPIPDTVKVSKSSVQFDDEGLPVPVKKKFSGNEPKFGGIVGTYAPQSEESKIAKALQTVKSSPATEGDVAREAAYKAVTSPKLQVTQEEFDEDPVSVSRKVILSKMPSVKRYDQPKSAEQEDKVAEFSFKEGDKEIENVKKFYSDNTNGSIAHLSKITGISNPDLLYSDEFDERIKSAVKPGNETDRLAYERLQDAKKARAVVRENLEQGKSFEDMAIDYAAANSPEMAKVIQQLKTTPTANEVMGGVTSVNRRPEEAFDEATIGRFLYDFYNSSAIRQEMEKIPGMTSKVVSGANQLIQKYPSFGKMYLGNLISQKMEDMGMNNAVLNVATKKERDKAVEALVAEDKMSPLEVQFYKDNIRNLSGLGLLRRKVTGNPIIDTPGALESAAGGAYGGFKNTIGGLYELTGLRESVLGSQGALRQDLEKTNTQVSVKPKGIVNQIAMNAGQFFGQSMSIGAGGKMINNIKLAKDPMTVMGMVGATQAYANYLPQARMMFPGNELKQKAYAFILSGIEWKTEKIFNDRKVVDGLLGKLKPSVVETIKDFTEKKISSEAARANIQSAIRRAIKDTPEAAKYFGKAVVQNDIEELSAELGGQVSRGIFENKPFDEWIDGEDLYETTKAATLGSPIIGSLSARADMQKNRGITAKTIYSMAQDPDYWKSQIMEGAKLDETLAAEAPDKIKNLETAAKIVQELDATKLTEKQKVKYVITELEKQLKAEQSKDAAIQAIPKAAISELEKVQQDILDGKDDGSIEGDKSDDLTPDETKAVKLAAKEGLPGMYGEIDPLDALQEISYQAQGIKVDEDGNAVKLEGGGRVEDLKRMGVSQELIDAAVKAFPNPPIDQQRELDMGDEGLRGEESGVVDFKFNEDEESQLISIPGVPKEFTQVRIKKAKEGYYAISEINSKVSKNVEITRTANIDFGKPGDSKYFETPEQALEYASKVVQDKYSESVPKESLSPQPLTEVEGGQIIEYKGERYIEKGAAMEKENGDLVPFDLREKIKKEGKPIEKPTVNSNVDAKAAKRNYSLPVSEKARAAIDEAMAREDEIKEAGWEFELHGENPSPREGVVAVGNATLNLENQNKGLGTLGYILEGEKYLKQGKRLISEPVDVSDPDYRSAQATKVWKKLVDLGLAEETSPGNYMYGGERMRKYQFPLPSKPVTEMNYEELNAHAKEVRRYEKRIKMTDEEVEKLSKEDQDDYYGRNLDPAGVYDAVEIDRIANRVGGIEEAETAKEISEWIKRPLIDYARKKDTENLAVIAAAKRRADELGIDANDLIKESFKRVAGEIKDESLVQKVFESISQPEPQKQLNESTQEATKATEPKPTEKISEPKSPTTEDSGGAKEPPKTPTEGKGVGEEGGRLNDKGILNKLYNAKRTPEAAKEGFKKEGLEYETKSQKEAQEVANALLDEVGIDEAVAAAEAMKFDGDVNSLIFAEALNRLKEQEDKATTPEAKLEAATRFAEVGITYDKMARYGGRFNAAINFFYQKSPLGIVMSENSKRKDDFNQWAKPKDKSWKEFHEDLMKEPEFAEQVKVQVQAELKKERAAAREARIKKVDDFFDKAKEQFKGGAAYSSIIPPKVITTALEGMKQAYRAGEAVGKIIQDAIDYISTELGNQPWDKEKFRNEWEEKLRDGRGKKPLSDEDLKLKVLDKFRKKLKGLSEKQKDEVIRRSHRKLIENGALDYKDLRNIIADVVGRGELTPQDAAKIKELVAKTNEVQKAAEKLREERTDEAFVNFRKAEVEAGKATKELNELFYNKPDIIKRLTSIMQLSTLGIPALINNPIYNLWNQATLRFPVGLINDLVDRGMALAAKTFGKNYEREYNVLETQVEFWEKLGFGAKEAFTQLYSGLNRQDYLQKEVYGQQIRPVKAFRDLIEYTQGKRKLSKTQMMDKAIQSTIGIPAEIVARALNIGDKPQRFAAEGSQASAFAKTLGLQGMDYKLFVEFPREEAYRAYKAQGLSDEVAAEKADYVKEAILKEGQRSTFQQDNLLTDLINGAINAGENKLGLAKDGGVGTLIKTLTISPYIKIPSNAFWSFYNLLNPEVAILQTGIHAGRAKAYGNKGETVKSKLQQREARYWMAHAIVGMAMRAAVIALVKAGVFTPGSDEDDSKKERDAVSYFDKPGSVTIGDVQISNRWFGQWGMMGNSIARKYKEATPEQREAQDDFWNIVLGGMEREGIRELQNGVFANTASILQAVDGGNPDRYLTSTLNMLANIVQPAAIAQINRASLDEVPSSKGDNFLDKLNKNFAQRSVLYRKAFGVQIDSKRDIWGQTIPKGGNILSRLFGISRINPQLFARPIYNDYLETNDSGFLPPAVLPVLNDIKLDTKQYDRLQYYIGEERKRLVEPYVNDMAIIEGFNTTYDDIKDPEDKKFVLQYLYNEGRDLGVEKFYQDFPELKKEKPAKDYGAEIKKDLFKILSKYGKVKK